MISLKTYIILFAFICYQWQSSQALEIYVNNNFHSTSPSGSDQNPFPTLQAAFDYIDGKISSQIETLTIYLEATETPYDIQKEREYYFNDKKTKEFTLALWEHPTNPSTSPLDCKELPKIDTSNLKLRLSSIPKSTFKRLNFINPEGSVKVLGSTALFLTNICVNDSRDKAKDFFDVRDVWDLHISDLEISLSLGKPIIVFSHTEPGVISSRVYIEGLNVNVLESSDLSIKNQEIILPQPCLRLILVSPGDTSRQKFYQNVYAKGIKVEFTKPKQFIPLILEIVNWDSLSLNSISIQDQDFLQRDGGFRLSNITELTLENIVIQKNQINSISSDKKVISPFTIKDIGVLKLTNNLFSENIVTGSSNFEANYRVIQVESFEELNVKNFIINSNKFHILSYIVRCSSDQRETVSIEFENINFHGNWIKETEIFYLFKYAQGRLQKFNVKGLFMSKNSLKGRVFHVQAVGNVIVSDQHLSKVNIQHKKLDFSEIVIENNPILRNCAFLFFQATNPSALLMDYVPDLEYYSLHMDNFTLKNNYLSKGENVDWQNQVSLIQVTGAQVLIQNSNLKNNTFSSYDFLAIDKEISSVFFVNNTVEDLSIVEGNLIITKYEALTITSGPFYNITNGKVNPMYRYAFVLDSKFSKIQITEGSLLTLSNAFLIIENNDFDDAYFKNSELLLSGKFKPPAAEIAQIVFVRDELFEEKSLSMNPYLFQVFKENADEIQLTNDEAVYFYLFKGNTMNKFYISSRTILTFQDYNFPQSFVSMKNNIFSDFSLNEFSTHVVDLTGSLSCFNFYNNTVMNLRGIGTLLQLSLNEENELFSFFNNTIRDFSGPSILIATGESISNMHFLDNIIENNEVSSSLISINFLVQQGDIIFSNNLFTGNVLRAKDESFNSKFSFLGFGIGASYDNHALIFENWNFTNNTYINKRSFSQFGQLNALFSLLLSNSSFIIRDSVFTKTYFDSQGNDIFYIAASQISIQRCSFSEHYIKNGQAIFNLIPLKVDFSENVFENLNISSGKGVILLNPYPFLRETITLEINKNTFIKCEASHNKLSGNVLMTEFVDLILIALNNVFINSIDHNPLFFFQNTTCENCLIENSEFILTENLVPDNVFFKVQYTKGNLRIVESTFEYTFLDHETDLLFFCKNSPTINVTIANISWTDSSLKSPLELAEIESGQLHILDILMENIIYPFDEEDTSIIDVIADEETISSVSLNLKNVTIRDIKFVRTPGTEKRPMGVIAFTGTPAKNKNIWDLNVENCLFSSLDSIMAIYLGMSTHYEVKISNSIFQSIKGRFGSALDYFPINNIPSSLITIENSTFLSNTATVSGGAIFLSDCVYSIKNCNFTNNTAADIGGALYLHQTKRISKILQQNIFSGNKASVGDNIASPPMNLKISLIYPNQTWVEVDDQVGLITQRDFSQIGIGVSLLDNDMYPTLDTANTAERFTFFMLEGQAPITSFNCTKAGCVTNSLNITLSGYVGQNLSMRVFFHSDTPTSNLKLSKIFRIQLPACESGEFFDPHLKTCSICSFGTYSLSPKVPCQACPEDAICPGGNILIARKGFWRESNETACFLECRKDGIVRCETLLDPTERFVSQVCAKGFSGHKCEACDFGEKYVQNGLLQCRKCENEKKHFLSSILKFVFYILIKLAFISKMSNHSEIFCTSTQEGYAMFKASQSNYYGKLLIMYTQILSYVYFLNMEVRDFFGSFVYIGNPSEFIRANIQCSLSFIGIEPEKFFYVSTTILILSPFVQSLIIIILILIFKKRFYPNIQLSSLIRIIIICMIIIEQPGMVGFLTSFFSCTKPGFNSTSYISLHPNWECGTPEYEFFKEFLVIPFLIFWAIVVPVSFFLALFFKRKRLTKLNVKKSLGSLYNLHKHHYYYWGNITMTLQLVMSYSSYTFQNDIKTCAMTLFILLWSYQFAIRQFQPYKYVRFNSMELLISALLMMNIILGYYTAGSNPSVFMFGAAVILTALNTIMITYIIWKMFNLRLKTILKSLNNLIGRKCFSVESRTSSSLLEDDMYNGSRGSFLEYEKSSPKNNLVL